MVKVVGSLENDFVGPKFLLGVADVVGFCREPGRRWYVWFTGFLSLRVFVVTAGVPSVKYTSQGKNMAFRV